MNEQEVDISPEVGGSRGRKTTVFQETELFHINENPSGLTKEGIEEEIALWKQSNNKHVVMKYTTMLQRCKKIQSSGNTPDGKIILARDPTTGVVTKAKDNPNTFRQNRIPVDKPKRED